MTRRRELAGRRSLIRFPPMITPDGFPLEMTPPELAKLARVGRDTVLGWIHSGELAAYNVADPSKERGRYRISREAWERFKEKRLHPAARLRRARLGKAI